METFFYFNDLVTAKQMLNKIIIYAGKKKAAINEDAPAIFHFHQALRSFVRACYAIKLKKTSWEINANPENSSPLIQASLSDEEYLNPALVFQKAFAEYSINDFDYYIAVAVYFSMGMYAHAAESKIFAPYIHLIKMLDAAHLILDRRIQKKSVTIKLKNQRMENST